MQYFFLGMFDMELAFFSKAPLGPHALSKASVFTMFIHINIKLTNEHTQTHAHTYMHTQKNANTRNLYKHAQVCSSNRHYIVIIVLYS